MNSDEALVIENLCKQFDPAGPMTLRNISFSVAPGQAVAIVGPSGSGKSTLLNIIGSLDKPTSGTVKLASLDVTTLSSRRLAEFRSRQVGFVFQDHHLLPQLSSIQNVLLPTLATGAAPQSTEQAAQLLARVGVTSRGDAFPSQLSGGERQRVAIARAMINSPRMLLCDEPTGNLDRENASRVVDLFTQLAREQKVIVLMVTHNLELAGRMDRCLKLVDGAIA